MQLKGSIQRNAIVLCTLLVWSPLALADKFHANVHHDGAEFLGGCVMALITAPVWVPYKMATSAWQDLLSDRERRAAHKRINAQPDRVSLGLNRDELKEKIIKSGMNLWLTWASKTLEGPYEIRESWKPIAALVMDAKRAMLSTSVLSSQTVAEYQVLLHTLMLLVEAEYMAGAVEPTFVTQLKALDGLFIHHTDLRYFFGQEQLLVRDAEVKLHDNGHWVTVVKTEKQVERPISLAPYHRAEQLLQKLQSGSKPTTVPLRPTFEEIKNLAMVLELISDPQVKDQVAHLMLERLKSIVQIRFVLAQKEPRIFTEIGVEELSQIHQEIGFMAPFYNASDICTLVREVREMARLVIEKNYPSGSVQRDKNDSIVIPSVDYYDYEAINQSLANYRSK